MEWSTLVISCHAVVDGTINGSWYLGIHTPSKVKILIRFFMIFAPVLEVFVATLSKCTWYAQFL